MALSQANIEARLKPFFPGEHGKQLVAVISNLNADLITLKAWGDALVAKLNADAGVTDTNYAQPNITTTGIG